MDLTEGRGGKHNKDDKGESDDNDKSGDLCKSLTEYMEKNEFDQQTLDAFMKYKQDKKQYKKNVRKNSFSFRVKQFLKKRKCKQQMSEYSRLNMFLNDRHKGPEKLKCDLVKPPIKKCVGKIKCKTIGIYFMQFNSEVSYNFFKTLLHRPKNSKDNPKGKTKKKVEKMFNSIVTKIKNIKNESSLKAVTRLIDLYYGIMCSKIVEDYNKFYDFYNQHYDALIQESHNPHCDFFIRLEKK